MTELFALRAQIVGDPHNVVARADGYGITVEIASGRVAAQSVREAERIARNSLGHLLHDADRRGLPWGLYVSVGGVAAVYGNWPLLPAPPDRRRSSDELVSRIRRQYREGSALAALENALTIISAYTSERRAA